jgi:Fe-S cluster assembly ATP-binding protein
MGPNGSGKSTLAQTIMGHPKCTITSGTIKADGEVINKLSPDERAKKGIFLSFQYPQSIPGITMTHFLRTAMNAIGKEMSIHEFEKELDSKMKRLGIDQSFKFRHLNEGFSGGEKKRAEILQMILLDPEYAILDETDSGLDIDAIQTVAKGIEEFNKDKCVVIITHHKKILDLIHPDKTYVILDGKIAMEGGKDIVEKLEEKGYGWLVKDQ